MTAAVARPRAKRVHLVLGGALAARAVIGHLALPLLAVVRGPAFLVLPILKPSEATLTVGGAIGADQPAFMIGLIAMGTAGGLASDLLSFCAGWVWGERVLEHTHGRLLGKRAGRILARTTDAVSRGGGAAVVLARPTVVAHGIAPIIAGATGFTTARFLRLATLGAFLWAVSFSLGGIAVGRLWRTLDPTPTALLAAGTIAIVGLVAAWRLRSRSHDRAGGGTESE